MLKMANLEPVEVREFTQPIPSPKWSGFQPRRMQQLATYQRPVNEANLEMSRILHSNPQDASSYFKSLEYQLWLEAGKRMIPDINPINSSYNANIWRNFSHSFGLENLPAKGEQQELIHEMSSIYPLNIPKPSTMGEYSYHRFVAESSLYKQPHKRVMALQRIREDEFTFRRMKAMTDARNPPMDKKGNILPPQGYRKYEHHFVPRPATPPEEISVPADATPDIFGNLQKRRFRPNLWKLHYRSTNPQYKEAMKFAEEVKRSGPRHPPALSRK